MLTEIRIRCRNFQFKLAASDDTGIKNFLHHGRIVVRAIYNHLHIAHHRPDADALSEFPDEDGKIIDITKDRCGPNHLAGRMIDVKGLSHRCSGNLIRINIVLNRKARSFSRNNKIKGKTVSIRVICIRIMDEGLKGVGEVDGRI